MTIRFISNPLAWSVWLVLPLWSSLANAQAPAPAATAPAPFRSALEGYQSYTEEKTKSWKEANDTAGSIGGWRVYAKEAQQPAATDTAAPKASAKPDPHTGHTKP